MCQFRIHIDFISVVDPDSFSPDPDKDADPAFQVNPDPDPGFWWKNTSENFFISFFDQKLQFPYH